MEVLEVKEHNPLQFDSPSKRYRFVTQFTRSTKTIEIRGFDTPMTIDWAIALAALIQCLAEKSKKLYIAEKRDTIVSAKRKYRSLNFQAAAKNGIMAKFLVDPTFHIKKDKDKTMSFLYHDPGITSEKKIPAHLAVKRLLYYIEEEVDRFGYHNFLQPIYEAIRKKENQASLQIKWFQHGYTSFFKKLTDASKTPWIKKERTSQASIFHYFLVRQRDKAGDDQHIDMASKGIAMLRSAEDETIQVSGPLRTIELKVRRDKRIESKIPLGSHEIGLGLVNRKKLGVSLYDPIIIGETEHKTFVTRKCGEEWTEPPPPKSKSLHIRKGIEEYGTGVACIRPKILKDLNLKAKDSVIVTSKESKKSISLRIKSKIGLREDCIAIMKKDREFIKAGIDDIVIVKKAKAPQLVKTDTFEKRFTVRKGSKTDSDDSIIFRLNPTSMKELSLTNEDRIQCYTLKEGEKSIQGEGVVRSSESTNLKLKKNEVGVRSEARKQIGVKIGNTILLSNRRNSN